MMFMTENLEKNEPINIPSENLEHTSHLGVEVPTERVTVLTKLYFRPQVERNLRTHSRITTFYRIFLQSSLHKNVVSICSLNVCECLCPSANP